MFHSFIHFHKPLKQHFVIDVNSIRKSLLQETFPSNHTKTDQNNKEIPMALQYIKLFISYCIQCHNFRDFEYSIWYSLIFSPQN